MSTPADVPPVFTPPPDWTPVDPFPVRPASHSFVSGAAAGNRTRVAYFRRPSTAHLHACVWFGAMTEGPPDRVHGGAIAAVLDEALGAVCWMHGHRVVGARITINYLHPVPLGFSGYVEAWIERIEGRKCFMGSRLTDDAGRVYAQGEGLFVKLRADPPMP
ncbi:MAG: PaaI family thioesterase [Acidobacteriota bacterium]